MVNGSNDSGLASITTCNNENVLANYDRLKKKLKGIRQHCNNIDFVELSKAFKELTEIYKETVIQNEINGYKPQFYIRSLVVLEDFINEYYDIATNDEQGTLEDLKTAFNIHAKDFESELAAYRQSVNETAKKRRHSNDLDDIKQKLAKLSKDELIDILCEKVSNEDDFAANSSQKTSTTPRTMSKNSSGGSSKTPKKSKPVPMSPKRKVIEDVIETLSRLYSYSTEIEWKKLHKSADGKKDLELINRTFETHSEHLSLLKKQLADAIEKNKKGNAHGNAVIEIKPISEKFDPADKCSSDNRFKYIHGNFAKAMAVFDSYVGKAAILAGRKDISSEALKTILLECKCRCEEFQTKLILIKKTVESVLKSAS